MRPKTIVYFERIIFGLLLLELVLGVLQTYLGWDQASTIAATVSPSAADAVNLIIQIFGFVLVATLTLLVSRRRNKIAMWVLISLFALYPALFVSNIIRGVPLETEDIITLAIPVGEGVAYGLLFTPSARRWMSREGEKGA